MSLIERSRITPVNIGKNKEKIGTFFEEAEAAMEEMYHNINLAENECIDDLKTYRKVLLSIIYNFQKKVEKIDKKSGIYGNHWENVREKIKEKRFVIDESTDIILNEINQKINQRLQNKNPF